MAWVSFFGAALVLRHCARELDVIQTKTGDLASPVTYKKIGAR